MSAEPYSQEDLAELARANQGLADRFPEWDLSTTRRLFATLALRDAKIAEQAATIRAMRAEMRQLVDDARLLAGGA